MSALHFILFALALLAIGALLGVTIDRSVARRNTWQRAPGVLDLVRSRGDRLELDALDAANRGRGWGRP